MNTEIEKEVIGILLNHPEKLEAIPLESDWFGYPEYRMLFEAMRKSASHDLFDVYGKYNQLSKTPLDFSAVKSMRNEFTLVSQLNNDIQLIRKSAYNRQLNSAIAEYQANPFSENEQALREILAKNETVESVDNGRLDEAVEELKDSLTHPKPRGISTFKKLDSVLGGGMYGSMLFTIGARPSTGKTAFAVNLAYEAMTNDKDVEVDIFTLEMNKQEMLNRFVSRMTGASSSTLRSNANELDDIVKSLIDQSTATLLSSKLRVYDGLENLGEIAQVIRQNASRAEHGKYMAIVDYIGLVKVPNVKERRLEIDEVTRELKRLTNEFDIPIVELSQLSRGIENRQDKRPVLSDLKESGSIEQDSNVVAFLHRPQIGRAHV